MLKISDVEPLTALDGLLLTEKLQAVLRQQGWLPNGLMQFKLNW